MTQSGYIKQAAPSLSILNESQIQEIKQAAYIILERTGCRVMHEEALQMLQNAGALVDNNLVKVPRWMVDECLASCPKGFLIYDREGNPALDVTDGKSYFGTSTASPNTVRATSGRTEPTRLQDIALGARVADALTNIDFVMPFGSAQDAPPTAGEVFEFNAAVNNTTKPIFMCSYSPAGLARALDMAAAVAGGREALKQKPFVVPYPEPITPLQYPEDVVGRIFICADYGIPQVASGAQLLGFTAPVTLAGAIALATAESFFSIVLAQLRSKGSPCFLTASVGSVNMRTGIALIQSPELTLSLAAQAELARSLSLPTWGLAGATDSKCMDAQAGAEAALDILAQALAGVNIIHDVGYMDMGMACSATMLVMGDEIISWVKRFSRGFEISAETMALEAIHHAGPGGNFLQEKHTVDHVRKECWVPELFCKETMDFWKKNGSMTLEDAANRRVEEIMESHTPVPLAPQIAEELDDIRQRAEQELS